MPSISASSRAASSGWAWLIRCRSPPAKKVLFALVSTTPVMSPASASSRATVSASDDWNRAFMVLAPWVGSSIVSVTMPSASTSQAIMLSVISVSSSSLAQTRSMMVARPMPPPMHSVTRP